CRIAASRRASARERNGLTSAAGGVVYHAPYGSTGERDISCWTLRLPFRRLALLVNDPRRYKAHSLLGAGRLSAPGATDAVRDPARTHLRLFRRPSDETSDRRVSYHRVSHRRIRPALRPARSLPSSTR